MPHSSEIFDALTPPITDENKKEAVNLLFQYMENSIESSNPTQADAENLLNSMLAYIDNCTDVLAIDCLKKEAEKEHPNPFAVTYLDMIDSLPLSILDGAKQYLKDQILDNMAEIYVAGLHYHISSFIKEATE